MKTCKRIFLPLFFMLVVTGCANVASTAPTSSPIATGTIASTLISITPTVAARPTPTPVAAEINPTADPSTWSADVQAQFKTVLTTPDKATQADWDAYNTYLVDQMRTTLKAAGVPNADTLNVEDYSLIKAMAEYARSHGYEFDLPPSMARLIVTDTGNLISTVNNNGYGVGGAGAPPLTHDDLLVWAKADWSHVIVFGKAFKLSDAPEKPFAMNIGSTEGDAVALLNIPGINPDNAQGVLIAMKKSDGTLGYGIVMAIYKTDSPPKTKATDLCKPVMAAVVGDCSPGQSLPSTIIVNNNNLGHHMSLTRIQLRLMLQQNPKFHVNAVYNTPVLAIWVDGMAVPFELRTDAAIPPAQ